MGRHDTICHNICFDWLKIVLDNCSNIKHVCTAFTCVVCIFRFVLHVLEFELYISHLLETERLNMKSAKISLVDSWSA